MPQRLTAAAAAAALLLLALPAAGYDPRLEWQTVQTPHFLVHYHDGLGELAQRAARALEAAHARLVPRLGAPPEGRLHVVLSDETDAANGSATTWLRPTMHLLAVPPDGRSELNDYEDYLWNLVVHEYAHILHLGDIRGLPSVVNRVFGQMWIPNGILPRWYIEGLAVVEESAQSGGGRGRSALYDMYLRAQVLEGTFFGIDAAGGSPSVWPRGGLAYLHGGRFLQWVAQTRGHEALAAFNHDYGGQILPFAVNATAKDHLGADYVALYDAWRAELEATVRAGLAAARSRGACEPRRLTFRGEGTGEPVYLDAERLLYLEDSADRRAALRRVRVDGGGDAEVRELYSGGTLALVPGGRAAIVSQSAVHEQFSFYEDLFRVDLASGALERLTSGARLTEPDVSPDGRTIAAAQRLTGGRMALVTLAIDGGPVRRVYEAPERGAVFTPRFSPDGRRLAFSEQRPGGRDLRLLDLATGLVEDLTRDRAIDLDPAFDPSGRWLLFASDRTGIYNIFARDLETGETRQLTDVLTGAFRPAVSPDGRRLALVTFSTQGYDVATLPLDPLAARAAPEDRRARPPAPQWETRELYPVTPYRPLATLRPYWWLPTVGADVDGMTLGLTTGGSDVVGRHAWSLQASWGLASNAPAAAASYSTRIYYPSLDLGASTGIGRVPGAPDGLEERRYAGSATLTFPFTRLDERFALSAGYELQYYDPDAPPLPTDPAEELPFRADRGLAATLRLGFSMSTAQGFANGISPERGFTFSAAIRGARPEWGSQFRYGALEGSFTKYLAMPWLEHHALAMRLAGGISSGDLGGRRVYALGGAGIRDPLMDLVRSTGYWGAGLRGYAPGAFSGSAYTLANVEYRFPIVRVDRGLWTLPFFLRRIHGALTCDVGEASDHWTWDGLKPSVGAELRVELLLGYALSTNLRLGYARGLAAEGTNDFILGLGSSF